MKNTILGAIAGDIIGSVFEWNNYRGKDFQLFNKIVRRYKEKKSESK